MTYPTITAQGNTPEGPRKHALLFKEERRKRREARRAWTQENRATERLARRAARQEGNEYLRGEVARHEDKLEQPVARAQRPTVVPCEQESEPSKPHATQFQQESLERIGYGCGNRLDLARVTALKADCESYGCAYCKPYLKRREGMSACPRWCHAKWACEDALAASEGERKSVRKLARLHAGAHKPREHP